MVFTSVKAQLTITDSLTAAQITNLLQGIGVTVSNLTVNGEPGAIGEFNGPSEMGIAHGLVLSTGSVAAIADSASSFSSTCWGTTGSDPNLVTVAGGGSINDKCILEFDCLPTGDTLMFNFSFGSEEYPEFVGAGFNDAFGIFLSGPGISGVRNVAYLPSGTVVSVDNVNATTNSGYFYDNLSSSGQYVSYDGFTVNLPVVAAVTPGGLYHFKIAICDVGDCIFDSGVFLEAFSFRSVSSAPLSVNEIPADNFSVYPNPGTGIYTLTDAHNRYSGSMIRVTNVLGETVFAGQVRDAATTIDLTGYAGGMYFLNIDSPAGVITRKIIKN